MPNSRDVKDFEIEKIMWGVDFFVKLSKYSNRSFPLCITKNASVLHLLNMSFSKKFFSWWLISKSSKYLNFEIKSGLEFGFTGICAVGIRFLTLTKDHEL